jgi:hypothetical protein
VRKEVYAACDNSKSELRALYDDMGPQVTRRRVGSMLAAYLAILWEEKVITRGEALAALDGIIAVFASLEDK